MRSFQASSLITIMLAFLVSAVSAKSASSPAFVVTRSIKKQMATTSPQPSQLFQSTYPSEDINDQQQLQQQQPSWFELPKLYSEKSEGSSKAQLEQAEFIVGRVAMVGAVSLLAKEILTGESFAEQFIHAFHLYQ